MTTGVTITQRLKLDDPLPHGGNQASQRAIGRDRRAGAHIAELAAAREDPAKYAVEDIRQALGLPLKGKPLNTGSTPPFSSWRGSTSGSMTSTRSVKRTGWTKSNKLHSARKAQAGS